MPTPAAQNEFRAESGPRRKWSSWIVAGLIAIAVAAVSVVAWPHSDTTREAQPGGMAAPGKGKPPTVRVVELQPRPFSVVLEGLGTVTPISTVTVRPQVDGPLTSVAFQEGAAVKRGQLLAEIDPRPFRIKLAQAKATVARDQAQLQNARLDLDRYKTLSEQKMIARQQLDSQQSTVDQLLATLAADEANVAEAQLQLQYTRIESPIDGVAGIRQVDPGNLVKATDTSGIVVLTQLDPIGVIFTLPQDQLTQLSAAMASAPAKVEVWSRDGNEQLALGTLQVIDNQINVQTASIRLKARFDNAERKLWPNQFVRARVTVAQEAAALVLPAVAVQHGPQGAYVYVLSASNTAQLKPIQVALLQGEDAVIGSGLQAGERVVTHGQAQVKPGGPVTVLDPNAAAEQENKRTRGRGAAGATGAK
jgi:membrane fusion protein, multidrug efflux system